MEASETDKRIDDLAARSDRFEVDVKERFDRVDREFDKIDKRFDKVDREFDKVDRRFDRLESKVDATNRTIWAGIFAAAMIKILFG
jgi:predicted nuclease with TOPRIM domain